MRFALFGALIVTLAAAARAQAPPFIHVPQTVSDEWRAVLREFGDPALRPAYPSPGDLAGWKQLQAEVEAQSKPQMARVVKHFAATIRRRRIGGVDVLDITPKRRRSGNELLVYTHGGGYVLFSAESTLVNSLVVADVTGLRVIAIDYSLAPAAKWREVTDQVVAVFGGLYREGHAPEDIAIFGESAGGGLAAGAVLKLRDRGLAMPAAVVLWSPWADLTETGDSYHTLKHAETSFTYDRHLEHAAGAYAAPEEQKIGYVSPVYGDYSKGFPPTLIQGGTKEILLSGFIRLYQAIDTAGATVKLDLYEGMPHAFQLQLPGAPESRTALGKTIAHLEHYLIR
ncbi:MAG: alpha/beta hydrolase fold domain-containing protein [Myxococcota bacterium]